MAQTATFNAHSADGSIAASGGPAWSTVRNATTGAATTNLTVVSGLDGGTYYVWRVFATFDTSSLPDDATVTSASVRFNCTNTSAAGYTGTKSVALVQSTQASNTALVDEDFDQVGSTVASTQTITTTGNYDFTVTASWVSLNGYTKLALRSKAYDVDNVAPSPDLAGMAIDFAATPVLTVNYTTPRRYWTGTSGNWSDTTKWAYISGGTTGASAPTTANDVYLLNASTAVITTNAASQGAANLDCTGFTGTLTSSSSYPISVLGNYTAASGMSYGSGSVIKMTATSTGKTITFAGKSIPNLEFNGSGGGWTAQDTIYAGNLTVANGTFNANNNNATITGTISAGASGSTFTMGTGTYTCSATSGSILSMSSGGTVTPSTSTITVSDTGASTKNVSAGTFTLNALNITGNNVSIDGGSWNSITTQSGSTAVLGGNITLPSTGSVFTAAASTITTAGYSITLSDTTSTTKTFAGGGNTFAALTINGTTVITGSNTFDSLTVAAGKTLTLTSSTTTTVTSAFTIEGTSSQLCTLSATTPSTAATIACNGTVTARYVRIVDSTTSGSGNFTAAVSIDGGGNTGWTFSVPTASYNTSLITAVARVQEGFSQPRFVMGGRGGTGGTTYGLYKKGTTYLINIWRSKRFTVGRPWTFKYMTLQLSTPITSSMSILPAINIDDGATTVYGTEINNTNYTNGETFIVLDASNFSGQAQGNKNFCIELTFQGGALLAVQLPINIRIETLDIGSIG